MTSLQKRDNRGQGLLETVLILPVALAFIGLLFFASYRALVYFYADHILHEAMICTDAVTLSACEQDFIPKLRKITLQKEKIVLRLHRSGWGKNHTLKGRVEISSTLKTKIKIEKIMRFPLKGSP
ncbi:hypothetical protein [Bdellovibrio sp. HCB288]|uniref:hypothetical protein n=1 Tax=Bdellovibrio sp. HCB288 TaxID=3394355 RepID=UPI0039B4E08A